jgi:cytochrome c peroxidase
VLARGRAVFEQAACDTCHVGELFTDRERHELDTSLGKVDTPSLRGLGQSAPYYHDGSAVDLAALLDNRATIHDMADTSGLSAQQKAELVAYLRSL